MKLPLVLPLSGALLAAVFCAARIHAAPAVFTPSRTSLDAGWKFFLGDPPAAKDDAFDDSAWRALDLPHDWSIEGTIDRKNPMSGAGGFFPSGTGWYRLHFDAPEAWRGQHVAVEFEGVYMNAEVFLNGESIGKQTYGYTTFFVDLDPQRLRYGGANVLAVRVDNSQQINSRWYSGSGIYRHVWLHVAGAAHFRPFEPSVETRSIKSNRAEIRVKCQIVRDNPLENPPPDYLEMVVTGPDGREAARWQGGPLTVTGGASQSIAAARWQGESLTVKGDASQSMYLTIFSPAVWSPDDPKMYKLDVRLKEDGRLIDQREVSFGVRTVAWSDDQGFQLNSESVKLCGGCVHHDNGILGAAAFDQAEERRVRLLKEAGFNAIRTSHNPPSPAFLDACDRSGMLVLDEAFDCWEKGKNSHDYHTVFNDQWQHDLDTMIARDRNHPCVVIWSIGNEVQERATPEGASIGRRLAERVRELDSSRPVTSAICPVGKRPWRDTDGLYAALDIGGYNYTLENAAGNPAPDKTHDPATQTHATDHARLPRRVMMSTESFPQDTFAYYDLVARYPYIVGDFVWTALDYLGESGIGRSYADGEPSPNHGSAAMFPNHGGSCGDLDLTGVRRPVSHYRNILWDRGEKIFMAVREPARADGKSIHQTLWSLPSMRDSWTWPGQEGKELSVEVYTKAEHVRLSLEDRELGEVAVTREGRYRAVFKVPYAAGTLKAEALQEGKTVAECTLATAGEPVGLRLVGDRADTLPADGRSVSFVTVEAVDDQGRLCPNAAPPAHVELEGPGTLAGFGNGDLSTDEPYSGNTHHLFQGRALVAVRSTHEGGEIRVRVSADGLPASETVIRTRVPDGK